MLTYQETLDYLFARLPMFSRTGSDAYKGSLDNIIALCNHLNNPQDTFKSIHIAGTNGKGSVSHSLAAILQSAGYKTGLYTSPHLRDFRERIRINGMMAEADFVVSFTERLRPLIEVMSPSFFEITVAMAFEYFAQQKVDIAVIETGLGGRLDSTNIITPILSVITNIGYDHMNILGDTLPEIAGEKAGIIKPQVPVVIGETLPATEKVFELKAARENAAIHFAQREYMVADWQQENHLLHVTVDHLPTDTRHTHALSLTGLYQMKNLLTILQSVRILQQHAVNITTENIDNGLRHVQQLTGFGGRWQVIHQRPLTVLDVAHNEDGMRQVISQLEHCTFDRLHIVMGMVKDKDISNVLSLMPVRAKYYFTRAQIPRALPENELLQVAAGYQLIGACYPTVSAALQQAVTNAHEADMILVCGSVFVVGEVDAETLRWIR